MVGFFCADLGEIWPVWKKFGDIRPKSLAEIQLRGVF
jgi:hypothetical protein